MTQRDTLISIIVPVYNAGAYIEETIAMVCAQTYQNWELILVDDCSKDDSRQKIENCMAKGDGRIRLIAKTVNEGAARARNTGLENAQGRFIAFLDADDIWDSSYLQEVYRLIKKYPDYDVFCLGYSSFNNVIKDAYVKYNLRKYIKTDDAVIDFFRYSVLRKGSIALTSAVVISKKLIERNQLKFPKGCSMGEDVDFWARACALKDIVYSNKSLMFYRNSCEDSLTSFGYKSIFNTYQENMHFSINL